MASVISGPTITGTASTADSSLFFAENSVPLSGSQVKRVTTALGGTNMTLTNVTRVQVFGNGVAFIDCPPAVLRAIYGFMCKRAEWSTSATSASVDFSLLMPGGAAPAGKNLRFIWQKNSTPSGTVTANIHEYADDSPASGYPSVISNSANIPASATTQPYNIQNMAGSVMAGIYIPDVANVTLLRYYDQFGLCYEFTSSAQIVEQFALYYGTSTFTDIFIPVRPSAVIPGVTRLEISTGGSWAGVTNEIGCLTYAGNPQ
jgi:hypothetical protein